jgi:SH3-like domain-containing protein
MNNIGNVKSAPNTTGNSIFVLHQGTKLKILEKAEGWDRIQIKDGRQGWIETSDIEVI